MNASPWLLTAALAAAAMAVGCDGSAAARATGGASQRAATSEEATPPAEPAPAATPGKTAAANAPDPSVIVETTFDDLKFPMEKTETFLESMLTDLVRSRFNRRIRIRGYMYPTNRKRGLTQFVLVRDNQECCFGPGAALFDCVLVEMRGGATAEFSTFPIAVEGEFAFDPLIVDGRPMAIYRMAGDAVK